MKKVIMSFRTKLPRLTIFIFIVWRQSFWAIHSWHLWAAGDGVSQCRWLWTGEFRRRVDVHTGSQPDISQQYSSTSKCTAQQLFIQASSGVNSRRQNNSTSAAARSTQTHRSPPLWRSLWQQAAIDSPLPTRTTPLLPNEHQLLWKCLDAVLKWEHLWTSREDIHICMHVDGGIQKVTFCADVVNRWPLCQLLSSKHARDRQPTFAVSFAAH